MNRPAPVHRLFFALWPDDGVRAAVAAEAARVAQAHAGGGRRLRPDRYHLTLRFLGEVPAAQRDAVLAAGAAAARAAPAAFDLVLDRAGGFADARVWWLAPSAPPAALQALWDALDAALRSHGVQAAAVPGFAPHLTTARWVAAPLPSGPVPPIPWRVDRLVLVESAPPAPYRLLAAWPLRG